MEPLTVGMVLVGGAVSAAAGAAAGSASGEELPAIWTQLGVFAICMAIAWFMLRRSDQRDAMSRIELNETLKIEREGRIKAEGRAEALEQQLVKLTEALMRQTQGELE